MKVIFKILKWLFIVLAAAIVLFLIVRFIGQKIYNRTLEHGLMCTLLSHGIREIAGKAIFPTRVYHIDIRPNDE